MCCVLWPRTCGHGNFGLSGSYFSSWRREVTTTRPSHLKRCCNPHIAAARLVGGISATILAFGKFAFSQSTISLRVRSGAVSPTIKTSTLGIVARTCFAASLSATEVTSCPKRRNSSALAFSPFCSYRFGTISAWAKWTWRIQPQGLALCPGVVRPLVHVSHGVLSLNLLCCANSEI